MHLRELISESNTVVRDLARRINDLSSDDKQDLKLLLDNRKPNVLPGTQKKSLADGETYRWKGAQWVNAKNRRVAKNHIGLGLHVDRSITEEVAEIFQRAKQTKNLDQIAKLLKDKTFKFPKIKKPQTDLIGAMQRATGRRGPSKQPGADPEIF